MAIQRNCACGTNCSSVVRERFRFASGSSSSFEKKFRMRIAVMKSPCGKSTVDYIYRVSPVAEQVGSQPLLFERRRRLGCTKRSGLSALL